jgi:hypothetical protein
MKIIKFNPKFVKPEAIYASTDTKLTSVSLKALLIFLAWVK